MLPGFETVTEINDEMNHSTLLVEQRDSGLLIVTLNRPDEGNAVNTQMGIELLDFWTGLVRDREGSTTRCVVLTGAGDAFCAGGDVKGFAKNVGAAEAVSFEERTQGLRLIMESSRWLHEMPKPLCAGKTLHE